MWNGKKFVLALVMLVAIGLPARGQERKGTISGRVIDSSGGVLQGAEVSLEAQGIKVVSDVQGHFFVRDLEPGSYTLEVTYVGFAKFTQTLTVSAGQIATVDAKLAPESQILEVLVTAERASGEAEAINRERSADNIVQVIPADVIRSLPNANMADALGRLPSVTLERDEGEGKYVQIRGTEPRLTNTTIDGMNVPSPESGVRQIKFDAIPADIVESVEINKTLQANMDGDGIGGSVNLVTKTAGERPTISLGGMGGYMPILGGRGQVETTGTVGQRFGAAKRLGVLIGGSYDWTGRGIDDIEPTSDVATFQDGSTKLWKDGQDIREYRYNRSRWGLAGSADYKLSEGSDIYIRGLFSNFKNYGDRWVYSLSDNTPVFNPLTPTQFPNAPTLFGSNGCSIDSDKFLSDGVTPNPDYANESCASAPTFNTQDRRPNIGVGSILLGGRHVLTTTWYSWDVSVGRSYLENVAPGTASFASNLSNTNCQYDSANTKNIYVPQWTPACFTEAYNPANLDLNDINISHGLDAQVNLQATAAMGKRYHIGSHLATVEFGGKFRTAHKFDDSYSVDFTPNNTIPLTQFPNQFTNNNYYSNAYKLGPNPTYETIAKYLNSNLGSFTPASTLGQDPANYDLVEKVSAGYVMNTLDLSSRVRIVAGLRFEGTNLSTLSFDTVANSLSDRANGSYLKILPSASLRYAFSSSTNLRLVYSRGLSRPDPVDIAQAVTYTTVGSPGNLKNLVTLGNPNLKAETADNFDVLVEHYLNPFGMISAGYFYKRLTDPIVTQTSILQNYQPTPIAPKGMYTATQPINAGSAWISGFEASYLQHLTFLPGALRGLGLSANYGYTASQANGLPGRSDHPRLLRNAPNTWNVSPTYDLGRFSIRVGLSYNQANISSYGYQDGTLLADGVTQSTPTPGGLKGPFSDQYFYTHIQVDAQGSIRLAHGLNFIMYGLNLTNEVFGFYQGSPQYMIQREYYQPTYAVGFRWTPLHEK